MTSDVKTSLKKFGNGRISMEIALRAKFAILGLLLIGLAVMSASSRV